MCSIFQKNLIDNLRVSLRYDSNVACLFIPAATVHALNTFDQIADDPDNVHVDSALKQKLFTYSAFIIDMHLPWYIVSYSIE